MTVHGLLLAAGAGRRMGGPKALVPGWLPDSVAVLREGGCATVTVVLGARAQEARALLPEGVGFTIAADWEEGMGASLRAGLQGTLAMHRAAEAVLVHLVDLPDVTADVVRRVVDASTGPATLARAAYSGVPGHPVLLGREHWVPALAVLGGDQGAKAYLAGRDVTLVECGDLATGADQDTPG